jgi:hypothetical protein
MTRLSLDDIAAEELARISQSLPPRRSGKPREVTFAPDLPGFGVRKYSTGKGSYIVQTRMDGIMRTVTIGSVAVLSAHVARDVARRILLRAQTGSNPADDRKRTRSAPSWEKFLEDYWQRMSPTWKPSTARSQATYRRNHLNDAFAGQFIDEVDERAVQLWFSQITERAGPGGANRAIDILSSIFGKAEAWGCRPANSNPCVGVRRNRGRKLERYLSDEELARLGRALNNAAEAEPLRVAALKLLLLCQSACKRDPRSARKRDPLSRMARRSRNAPCAARGVGRAEPDRRRAQRKAS